MCGIWARQVAWLVPPRPILRRWTTCPGALAKVGEPDSNVEPAMQPSRDISRLIEIMAALRNPVGGCPWDLVQDFSTIRHYTIEEAYEVADAIERRDFSDFAGE